MDKVVGNAYRLRIDQCCGTWWLVTVVRLCMVSALAVSETLDSLCLLVESDGTSNSQSPIVPSSLPLSGSPSLLHLYSRRLSHLLHPFHFLDAASVLKAEQLNFFSHL